MAVESFEHSIFINAAPEVCCDLFFDPVNFLKTNPLVVEILDVTPGKTAEGYPFHTFYVVDKIPIMGNFAIRFKYWTRMTKTRDDAQIKQLISETRSFPNVQLRNIVTFTVEGGGTQVHEAVNIETSPLFMNFSLQQAKQAHHALLANLKTVSE